MEVECQVLVLRINLMNAFPLEEGKRGTLNTAILRDTSMDSVQWICAMLKLFISQIPMLCISFNICIYNRLRE